MGDHHPRWNHCLLKVPPASSAAPSLCLAGPPTTEWTAGLVPLSENTLLPSGTLPAGPPGPLARRQLLRCFPRNPAAPPSAGAATPFALKSVTLGQVSNERWPVPPWQRPQSKQRAQGINPRSPRLDCKLPKGKRFCCFLPTPTRSVVLGAGGTCSLVPAAGRGAGSPGPVHGAPPRTPQVRLQCRAGPRPGERP